MVYWRSNGPIPAKLNPPHITPVAVIIVDRNMFKTSIVPKCYRARLPIEATSEFRPRRVLEKVLQQRLAFFLCHTLKIIS